MYPYLALAATTVVGIYLLKRYLQHRQQAMLRLRRGLEVLRFIRELMDNCQKHRGLANALNQGNNKLLGQLTAVQSNIDRALQHEQVSRVQRFPQWQSFIEHWPRLRRHSLAGDLKNYQLLRQHNIMIDGQLSLFDDVARYYDLHKVMLDNKTRVSELCLDTLRTAETIGQTRAVGSGLCAHGRAEGADAMMLDFLRRSLRGNSDELLRQLAAIDNDRLQQSLQQESRQIAEHVSRLLELIEHKILIDGPIGIDSQHYFELASQPIEVLLRLFGIILDHTEHHYAELN